MNAITAELTMPTEPDARWQNVLTRERAADGGFVYAVRTTGVYCRPSCPSRTARRQNVAFYATPADAEAAGFRACRRCAPKGPAPAQAKSAMVAAACRLIEAAEELPRLDALAAAAGISVSHFHRQFKAVAGLTPRAYGAAHRAGKFRAELDRKAIRITDAIYGAGFSSSSRCYEQSGATLGMTPTAFRDGGRNAEIRFAVGQCALGAILVACTEKGICAIALGDDPNALVRDLENRFPQAELIGGDAGFEQLIAAVIGFVEAPAIGLDLPLELRGTVFQQRVWQTLRGIPAGDTVTYAELAARIGRPKAVRAVARACAANAIAVAIPCHRVIRTDGALSGYRWGIERKRALLEKEATPSSGSRSSPRP